MSHARRPLMINIVAHNTVECTVVLLISVMMVIGVVTMTTVCWILLLRCMMHAFTGVVQKALAIRYETIWCRWWQLLLATGRRSTIGCDGWWLFRDLTSDVRLIWLDFTCTAMTQSEKNCLRVIENNLFFFFLFRTFMSLRWHCANIWALFCFCALEDKPKKVSTSEF